MVTVTVSEWIVDNRLKTGSGIEFAIGDVHGMDAHLAALQATIRTAAKEAGPERCHLTYLGDLTDRGPDSRRCLALAAQDAEAHGVGGITRLLGNHEQYLRLFLERGERDAFELWRKAGADETFASFGVPFEDEYHGFRERLIAAVGQEAIALLRTMVSHRRAGNLLFVHAGIDPSADVEAFLSDPWETADWAWIRWPFLQNDQDTFQGGLIVVHGHTPEPGVVKWQEREASTSHRLMYGRLNLDGGSYNTRIVAAAQIEAGRYRIFTTAA